MKLALSVAALVAVGTWIYRTFRLPQTNKPTVVEQRKAAFADLPKRYRRTQEGKPAKPALRLARRKERVG